MWVLKSGKAMPLTSALAKRFADMTPCPDDRALKPTISKDIRQALENGQFRGAEWASVFCKQTNEEYRVNGKHTSTECVKLNGSLPNCKIFVQEFEAETLEDVADLYATFDTGGLRTQHDLNKVYAGANPNLASVPSKIRDGCVTGMGFFTWEISERAHNKKERVQFLVANPDFPVWVADLLKNPPEGGCDFLLRGPVFACMFGCYKKSQSDASKFWSEVRDGGGKRGEPSWRLYKTLLTASISTGRGASRKGKDMLVRRAMYIKCLLAWNAWRSGTSTDLKYYPNAKTPAYK